MQVSRPEEGTGAPKRPTMPPKRIALSTDVKKPLLLAASPPSIRAVKPGCPMWGSGRIMRQWCGRCQAMQDVMPQSEVW
jgi:hypothetical protein